MLFIHPLILLLCLNYYVLLTLHTFICLITYVSTRTKYFYNMITESFDNMCLM